MWAVEVCFQLGRLGRSKNIDVVRTEDVNVR